MTASDFTYASAAEMAAALGARQVSAVELARAAIARVETCEPKLNAVCVRDFERGLAAARAADVRLARGERGALIGVPMTIKESYNLAGTPTTWGIPDAREFFPAEDALAVQRVKRAGAVILGKTNVPLNLGDWQSYNDIYGVTNNPYDLGRSPGGSSGGSAAALAAGYGALSMGSDIGGSLRVPAHFCGVAAHKPTHNLCPPRGHTPPRTPVLPGSVDLSVIGPMARNAADLEALLDVLAGPDELDDGVAYRLQLAPPRAQKLGDFRVLALTQHPMSDTETCVTQALETLAGNLARSGAKVARASEKLPDLAAMTRIYCRLMLATFSARWPDATYANLRVAASRLAPDDSSLFAERLRGGTASFREWFTDNVRRNAIRARWRAFFQDFDALICPVTPTPAFPHDRLPDQEARVLVINDKPHLYGDSLLWSGVATLAGLPATVVPIGRSPDGLPIGAQIVGPFLEDRTPIELAKLIEREYGGFSPPAGF